MKYDKDLGYENGLRLEIYVLYLLLILYPPPFLGYEFHGFPVVMVVTVVFLGVLCFFVGTVWARIKEDVSKIG